jgi:hypothetical protein
VEFFAKWVGFSFFFFFFFFLLFLDVLNLCGLQVNSLPLQATSTVVFS